MPYTCAFWHAQGQINVLLLLNVYEIHLFSLNVEGLFETVTYCEILRLGLGTDGTSSRAV